MKRIHLHLIIYITILLGLPSCENEIPYTPEMKQPCLVMNALLEAGDDKTNEVFLYLSTGDNLGKLNKDATLSLFINGRLSETLQEADPGKLVPPSGSYAENFSYKKYYFTTPLRPGDLVRLERSTGSPASPGFPCGYLYRPAQYGQRHRHSPPSLPRDSE